MVIIYYNNEIELILANSRVKDVNVRVKNHSFSQEV